MRDAHDRGGGDRPDNERAGGARPVKPAQRPTGPGPRWRRAAIAAACAWAATVPATITGLITYWDGHERLAHAVWCAAYAVATGAVAVPGARALRAGATVFLEHAGARALAAATAAAPIGIGTVWAASVLAGMAWWQAPASIGIGILAAAATAGFVFPACLVALGPLVLYHHRTTMRGFRVAVACGALAWWLTALAGAVLVNA